MAKTNEWAGFVMKVIQAGLFLLFIISFPVISFAATPEEIAALAHAMAAKVNASGLLPMHVQNGLMITEYESSGVYLIINAEMTKTGLFGLGSSQQFSDALRKIAIQRYCSSPVSSSILKTGLIIRANYRIEGSKDIVMTFDVSQKTCETENSPADTENNIHNYLVASLNLKKQPMPGLSALGDLTGADVIGNNIVYKFIIKKNTISEKFQDQSYADRFRAKLCAVMHDGTMFRIGAGAIFNFYSDPTTKVREIAVSRAICKTVP